jgi:hypothetical protein
VLTCDERYIKLDNFPDKKPRNFGFRPRRRKARKQRRKGRRYDKTGCSKQKTQQWYQQRSKGGGHAKEDDFGRSFDKLFNSPPPREGPPPGFAEEFAPFFKYLVRIFRFQELVILIGGG